jgi:hypothetical protein
VPVPRARDVSPPLRGPEKMTYEKMQRRRAQQKENKEKRIMLQKKYKELMLNRIVLEDPD